MYEINFYVKSLSTFMENYLYHKNKNFVFIIKFQSNLSRTLTLFFYIFADMLMGI